MKKNIDSGLFKL